MHLAIAIAVFPLYLIPGELFKLVLLPYVCFMVWDRKAIYLPALIIHFTPGTTVSLFMLLTALLVCLVEMKTIKRYKLIKLFRLYLLALPVFVYLFYNNFVENNISFSLSLNYTAFYLGIVSFFYGTILAHQFDKLIYRSVLVVLFILTFLRFLPFDISIRIFWLSFPFYLALLLANLTKFNRTLYLNLPVISFIFVVFGIISGAKFTLLLSGFFSYLLFFLLSYKKKHILKYFTGVRLVVISVATVIFIIVSTSTSSVYDTLKKNPELDSGISFSNLNNLWLLFKYKAFDDRGIIWSGGWDHLLKIQHFWPTGEVPEYSYSTSTGAVIDEVAYGIHNIGLELMRNYGIIIGAFLTFIYIYILSLLMKAAMKKNDSTIKFVLAVLIGVGFIGGMVGQFVLQPTFSFIFLSLAGIFFVKENLVKNYG